MELKQLQKLTGAIPAAEFYSYLYGIETRRGGTQSPGLCSFTRTFMELKPYICGGYLKTFEFYSYLYGIETCLSNVAITETFVFYSYLYGIETASVVCVLGEVMQFYSYLYGIETVHDELNRISAPVLLVPLWN